MAELKELDTMDGFTMEVSTSELDTIIFALRTCIIEIECRDLYKSLSKQRDDILSGTSYIFRLHLGEE